MEKFDNPLDEFTTDNQVMSAEEMEKFREKLRNEQSQLLSTEPIEIPEHLEQEGEKQLAEYEYNRSHLTVNILDYHSTDYPEQLFKDLKRTGIIKYNENKKTGDLIPYIDDVSLLGQMIAEQGHLMYNDETGLVIYEPENLIWKIDKKAIEKLVTGAIVNPLLRAVKIPIKQQNELITAIERQVTYVTPSENPFVGQREYIIPFTKTFNVHTNEFQEAKGDDYVLGRLKHTPIKYDLSEKQPFEDWLEFLLGDSKRTFLEFLGLSFFNKASLSQSALVSVGNTLQGISDHGNGKSEVQLVVKRCFETIGKDLQAEVSLADITSQSPETKLMPLVGALVNFDDDVKTNYLENIESLKKLITGQAQQKARNLYSDGMMFQNKANFWLNANQLPQLSSRDGATERRLDLLVFQNNMRDVENQKKSLEIYDYKEKLLGKDDTDIRKLIYLAIQTARNKWYDEAKGHFNQNQLYQSETALRLKGEWQTENNPVKQFLNDSDYIMTNNESDFVNRSDLYNDFKEWWAENNSAKVLKHASFRKLVYHELELKQVRGRLNNGDIEKKHQLCKLRVFYGIKHLENGIPESDKELPF